MRAACGVRRAAVYVCVDIVEWYEWVSSGTGASTTHIAGVRVAGASTSHTTIWRRRCDEAINGSLQCAARRMAAVLVALVHNSHRAADMWIILVSPIFDGLPSFSHLPCYAVYASNAAWHDTLKTNEKKENGGQVFRESVRKIRQMPIWHDFWTSISHFSYGRRTGRSPLSPVKWCISEVLRIQPITRI